MGCWANLVVLDLFNPTGQKSCSVSVVLWEDQDFYLETVRVGLAPDFFFFLDISVIVLFLRLFAIVLSCSFFFFTSLPSCSSRLTSNVFGPTSPLFLLSTRPNQLHPVCPVAVLWSKWSKTDWCWFDWLTQYLKLFCFLCLLSDERDRVQKKTFTKWVNKHLVKVRRDKIFYLLIQVQALGVKKV